MDQQFASRLAAERLEAERLEADLFLVHAPSVLDFRERDDMLFAYLSDSDSVKTRQLLGEMERALTLDGTLPAGLRDAIRSYNRKILAYSSDQIMPVRRPFGGRWFDDHTIPQAIIEDLLATPASAAR